jgi:hypothetical protein
VTDRGGGGGIIFLVGVRSKPFPRVMDLAREGVAMERSINRYGLKRVCAAHGRTTDMKRQAIEPASGPNPRRPGQEPLVERAYRFERSSHCRGSQRDLDAAVLSAPLRRIVGSDRITLAMPDGRDEVRLHPLGNQILHHAFGALLR